MNELIKSDKRTALFPWVELIPFAFYVLAILYTTAPNDVLSRSGLQEIGAWSVPVAAIAGIIMAIFGFINVSKLNGWRKTLTMILSIINATVFFGMICGTMYFIVLLLRGAIVA